MCDHTHQYNNMGEQRISTVPTRIESLPHTSFLENHSSCIIEKSGEAIENVHKTDRQNTATIDLSPTETSSSDAIVISTRSRTQQFKWYPYLLPTTYSGSHPTSQEGNSFDRVPVSTKHMRRSLLPFLGDSSVG